jgi:acyl-CoA thioesterase
MSKDLSRSTAVTRIDGTASRFAADLGEGRGYVLPSGGVLMTVAMRAMTEELDDPTLWPISATATFFRPVHAGRLEAAVRVLRRGRAAVQLRAELGAGGTPGLEVTATYGRSLERGVDVLGIRPPDVRRPPERPDAGNVPRVAAGHPVRPFFDQFDMRLAHGEPLWARDGWRGGEARSAIWYRYHVPLLGAHGALDPLTLPPLADTMPDALANALGPESRFYAPSLDLTVQFLDKTRSEWLLVDKRCERAYGGYATASANLWDGEGRLVARATHTMMLRAPESMALVASVV